MTIMATIQDGNVVCDTPVSLPNGTRVTLVPESTAMPETTALPERPKTLAERIPCLVNAKGDLDWPEDASLQHDHYLYGMPKR